jgi:hypothetical protein
MSDLLATAPTSGGCVLSSRWHLSPWLNNSKPLRRHR